MYDRITLERALIAVGDLLADRGHTIEVVAIGGGALSLLGHIDRSTEDIDLVGIIDDGSLLSAAPLPPELAEAVEDVAGLLNLNAKWMNHGPTSLLKLGLPTGFLERCSERRYNGLIVRFASRYDQIHLKLYATGVPKDKHHQDLRRLAPTQHELREAATWVLANDSGMEVIVRGVFDDFGFEFGDE